jgi:preprotein translocase subunit YajC
MMGNGVEGTVTAVAADHYTIKTFTGETYTVNYSANTRFLKQPPGAGQGMGQGQGQGQGQDQGQGGGYGESGQRRGQGGGRGMNRMEQIKSTDIKVGDAVTAAGQVDATAKTVGAVAVVEMDPARAKEMAQLAANYGKTWLMGKVTAINETKVTIMGSVDNTAHTFMADENTVFRKQRDPVTLADIQVGDTVRVEGATGTAGFTATTVNVMPAPGSGANEPRNRPQQ